jgi:hypothetical protein
MPRRCGVLKVAVDSDHPVQTQSFIQRGSLTEESRDPGNQAQRPLGPSPAVSRNIVASNYLESVTG